MQNSLNSLTEKLRSRTEKERQDAEALIQRNFDALSQNLSASSKNALSTTEAAILESLSSMERNISSRCRSLKALFSAQYRTALLWSFGILLLTTLSVWGLITLGQYRIGSLRQEIAELSTRKATLEEDCNRLWSRFKGVEPYKAEGKDYMLTLTGWQIVYAGKVSQRDAWEVVRK